MALAFGNAIKRQKQLAIAFDLGVSISLVQAWADPAQADAKTLPAYVMSLLPREERTRMFAEIEARAQEIEKGDG